jgi:hypothetical protein
MDVSHHLAILVLGCSELSENTKLCQYDKQELRERQIKRYFEMLDCISPSPKFD